MKRFLPHLFVLAFVVASLPAAAGSAHAAGSGYRTVTFSLRVIGEHDPHMTFWVAYGPLAGKFGLIRLHGASNGRFVATRTLPSTDRSVFSYVAGTGTVRTKLGPAPGGPSFTVARVGPTTAVRASQTTMVWRGPLG